MFLKNVTTLFNNDYDNSAKLGKGRDKEYIEDYFGSRISGRGIKARYLRVYSNGSTSSPYALSVGSRMGLEINRTKMIVELDERLEQLLRSGS